MIIGFSVGNFRSFLSEQSLSFLASSDDSLERSHCLPTRFRAVPRLIRSAVLFGPNGSGKSNLVAALRAMREMVLHSGVIDHDQYSQLWTPFSPRSVKSIPTNFRIDVLIDGLRYQYGFAYNDLRIVKEELRVFRSSKSQLWFSRAYDASTGSEQWSPFSPGFLGSRARWRRSTGADQLFLSTASREGAEQLQPLFYWFKNQLNISISQDPGDLSAVAARLKDSAYKNKVLGILRAVDIGVVDVRSRMGVRMASGPSPAAHRIELQYPRPERMPVWVKAEDASAGTKQLLALLNPLLDGIEESRFVAIDDFDIHLHPLIARYLIHTINNAAMIDRASQFLLVSHDTSLLDLAILRRDEFWLVNADARTASSQLHRLKNFHPRKRENVAKAYLQGHYGAVPRLELNQTAPRRKPS